MKKATVVLLSLMLLGCATNSPNYVNPSSNYSNSNASSTSDTVPMSLTTEYNIGEFVFSVDPSWEFSDLADSKGAYVWGYPDLDESADYPQFGYAIGNLGEALQDGDADSFFGEGVKIEKMTIPGDTVNIPLTGDRVVRFWGPPIPHRGTTFVL